MLKWLFINQLAKLSKWNNWLVPVGSAEHWQGAHLLTWYSGGRLYSLRDPDWWSGWKRQAGRRRPTRENGWQYEDFSGRVCLSPTMQHLQGLSSSRAKTMSRSRTPTSIRAECPLGRQQWGAGRAGESAGRGHQYSFLLLLSPSSMRVPHDFWNSYPCRDEPGRGWGGREWPSAPSPQKEVAESSQITALGHGAPWHGAGGSASGGHATGHP